MTVLFAAVHKSGIGIWRLSLRLRPEWTQVDASRSAEFIIPLLEYLILKPTRSESEPFSTCSIRAYSICAPEALMMGAHFASSALMNSAVLAGVMPGVGSIPASCRRWRTAGSASALVMAALSASIIG